MADAAHILHTPLTVFLDMDFLEFARWYKQAARIAKRMAGV